MRFPLSREGRSVRSHEHLRHFDARGKHNHLHVMLNLIEHLIAVARENSIIRFPLFPKNRDRLWEGQYTRSVFQTTVILKLKLLSAD